MLNSNFIKVGLGLYLMVFVSQVEAQTAIISGSPEAAALIKSVDFPVDLSTGVVSTNIPFFNVQVGRIQLPLGISYHGGGIKNNERSTWSGLGWKLNGELEITRIIKGLPDEKGYLINQRVSSYDGSYPVEDNNFKDYKIRFSRGFEDEEPDEFYYSLAGKSGKFYFQKYGNNSYKAVTVPYEPLKITYNPTEKYFEIVDVDGTKYRFGKSLAGVSFIETTTVSPSQSQAGEITSWKCTDIVSPGGTDHVTFNYYEPIAKSVLTFMEKVEVLDKEGYGGMLYGYPKFKGYYFYNNATDECNINRLEQGTYIVQGFMGEEHPNGGSLCKESPDPVGGFVTEYKTQKRNLKEMLFKEGKVVFNLGSNKTLNTIQLYNLNNELTKDVKFYQRVIGFNSTDRYLLDSVCLSGISEEKETYAFNYKEVGNEEANSNLSDYWGYSVGGSRYTYSYSSSVVSRNIWSSGTWYPQKSTFTPYSIRIGDHSSAVSESNTQTNILKRIRYPGKGYSLFYYESNKYIEDGQLKLAGGVRIAKIEYYDGISSQSAFEKIYKYGVNENGAGIVKKSPELSDSEYTTEVVDFIDIVNPNYLRKRTYYSNSLITNVYSNGASVLYGQVSEYKSDMGTQSGKKVYHFNNGNNYNLCFSCRIPNTTLYVIMDDWHLGQLDSVKSYAMNDGQYVWVKKQQYNYYEYLKPDQIHVGQVFRRRELIYYHPHTDPNPIISEDILYHSYGKKVGKMLLSSEIETNRNLNDTTLISTDSVSYQYGNLDHLQPTLIVKKNSNGNNFKTYLTYPQDYSPGTLFLDYLVSNNMIKSVIEEVGLVEPKKGRQRSGDYTKIMLRNSPAQILEGIRNLNRASKLVTRDLYLVGLLDENGDPTVLGRGIIDSDSSAYIELYESVGRLGYLRDIKEDVLKHPDLKAKDVAQRFPSIFSAPKESSNVIYAGIALSWIKKNIPGIRGINLNQFMRIGPKRLFKISESNERHPREVKSLFKSLGLEEETNINETALREIISKISVITTLKQELKHISSPISLISEKPELFTAPTNRTNLLYAKNLFSWLVWL